MLREKSCGALVVRRDEEDGKQYLLMIRHKLGGHRSFPKGHMEPGETEEQTALREIYEEVGLRVRLLPGFRAVTEYPLPDVPDTRKRVVFFLAEYENQEVTVQESELAAITIAPWPQALELTEFADSKRILTEAHEFLTK